MSQSSNGSSHQAAYNVLADQLAADGIDVEALKSALKRQHIETPSWGYANSGTRFKAVEAFAAGLPVVSTVKGIEGLELDDGVHFLAAETTEAFVEAIARLHEQRADALRIARAAYRLGLERYSMDALQRAIAPALPPARGAHQ